MSGFRAISSTLKRDLIKNVSKCALEALTYFKVSFPVHLIKHDTQKGKCLALLVTPSNSTARERTIPLGAAHAHSGSVPSRCHAYSSYSLVLTLKYRYSDQRPSRFIKDSAVTYRRSWGMSCCRASHPFALLFGWSC